jgi:hypothetical protein
MTMTVTPAGVISGSAVYMSGIRETLGGTIALSTACKVSGTFSYRGSDGKQSTFTARGASEHTGTVVAVRPNFLTITYRNSSNTLRILNFVRA